MKIANFIFENDKTELAEIENDLSSIARLLANEDEFPMGIYQHLDGKSAIASKLQKLINTYGIGYSKFNKEDLLSFLKGNDPITYFMLEDSNFSNEVFLCHLVEADIYKFFPQPTDFVNLDITTSDVAKTVKGLIFDSDGLVGIDNNFKLENQHIIYKDKYKIYYHPFIRRGFGSNFTDITGYLKQVASRGDLKLSIALDPLRISESLHPNNIREFDYWYGPKFDPAKLNEPNFVGLTVHTRRPDPKLDAFHPLIRTEFYITNTKDGKKQIEIEDIIPTLDKPYTLHKYVHMLWDSNSEIFFHFDPAIKAYEKNEHVKRIAYQWSAKDPNEEAKCKKIKMFRIDGSLDTKLCMNILGDFYRNNELIQEFFGKSLIA